jgi:hypothetical protein
MGSQTSGNSPKAVWFGYVKLLFLFQEHESRGSHNTHNAEVSFKYCIIIT